MKVQSLFLIAAIGAVTFLSACKNNATVSKNAPVETTDAQAVTPPATTPALQTDPPKTEPAQNAKGVWHYTCAKGCEGGAGSAVACAKCGATLVHNAAYHDTPPASTTTTPSTTAPSSPIINTQPAITTDAPKTEPAQNAKGVWHYTCASGCAGGGGSATA